MNETFGTRLRLQRERQQVDLTAISASTKISHSLLERLERDDVEHWPVGIFRRAYVRAYAAAIGLDPEAVLREFLERYPEPAPSDPFSIAEAQAAEDAGGRPSATRLGQIVRSAMAAMPGFLRSSRPETESRPAIELSRMHLAVESADDRESWDYHGSFEPAPVPVSRREDARREDALREDALREDATAPRVEPAAVEPLSTTLSERAASEGAASDRAAGDRAASISVNRPAEAAGHDGDAPPADAATPRTRPSRHREPDLISAAALCTRFAQVRDWHQVDQLLGEVARVLDAIGLVVWSHTGRGDALAAVLAHGYPPAVLARMPVVPRTADNAIAAAFRSAQRSIVPSEDGRPGALVVPLLAATGCAGVLALELTGGAERSDGVGAFADIIAAQLAPLFGATLAAEAVSA